VIEEKSSIALMVDGKREPLVLGEDAILGTRSPQPKELSAPLVFSDMGCIFRRRSSTTSTRPSYR